MNKSLEIVSPFRIMLVLFACSVNSFAGQIQYTYDSAGRLVAEDYGGGKFSTYVYDRNGNLLSNVTAVAASADVRVAKTSSLTTLPAGQVFFYTIVAHNDGPDPAPGVVVTDVLPFGVAPVGLTVSQGYGEIAGNSLTVNFGLIPSGGSATNSLTARHGFAGSFTNIATVAATPADSNLANNTAARATTATAPADSDSDGIPDWWEQLYFGNVFNAQPAGDADGDGASDLDEFIADTNPNDPNSVFRIVSITRTPGNPDMISISFLTSPIRQYTVQFTDDIGNVGFATNQTLQGDGSLTIIDDDTAISNRTYRIGVNAP